MTSLDGLLGSVNLLSASVASAVVSVVISLAVASVDMALVVILVKAASVDAFVVGAR